MDKSRDWLITINSWLNRNYQERYAFKEMSLVQWALVKRYKEKIVDRSNLHIVLDTLDKNRWLERGGVLSRYAVACIDGIIWRQKKEKKEKEAKHLAKSGALIEMERLRQDKLKNPEKYWKPE